jgi:hypothetical protein
MNMKKQDWITVVNTALNIALIFLVLWVVLIMFSGCGASSPACSAYKEKPKHQRTEQKSKASDPKPKISRGYVNYLGTK